MPRIDWTDLWPIFLIAIGGIMLYRSATPADLMAADTDAGRGASTATLELADWRRRIADLYAEVRALAATDVEAALELWRATRERLFREHPQSPVPADERAAFEARHFPADPSLRFEVAVRRTTAPPAPAPIGGLAGAGLAGSGLAMDLPVSAGGTMSFSRIGHVEIPFADGPRRLGVYWMAGYAGGIFLPFRDATSGDETYARRPLPARRGEVRRPRRRPGARDARSSTSTSRSSRRARSTRSGPARWRRRRTASTSRSGPASAWPDGRSRTRTRSHQAHRTLGASGHRIGGTAGHNGRSRAPQTLYIGRTRRG